jgi:hypothetical protein
MSFQTRAFRAAPVLWILGSLGAAAVALLAFGGQDRSPAATPRAQAGAARTRCAQQSSAKFPGAYADRRNLVVGPLALVGASTFTDAATAHRFGGNKFPLLVRAGHTVTVSVAPSGRRAASLGYGSLARRDAGVRDGHHTVTFVACSAAESLSTADGPVTFWSGFVMVSEPRCVPLDVYVDDDRPRRVKIELGRRCATPPPLRDRATHADGGKPSEAAPWPEQIVLGPLRFAGLAAVATRRELAIERSGGVHRVKAGGVAAARPGHGSRRGSSSSRTMASTAARVNGASAAAARCA